MSSKMTITVTGSNAASKLVVSTSGRYKRLVTNTIGFYLPGQPLYTTTTEKAYWTAVLAVVQAQIAALP